MLKVLVLDNYDSFTYNLVHFIRDLGHRPDVLRNDRIGLADVRRYDKILLSPGPGLPRDAGITSQLIDEYSRSKSILGVCLGHQAIAEAFGAKLFNMTGVLHGVVSTCHVEKASEKLFHEIPTSFEAAHYHSWAVRPETIGEQLEVTALNAEGLIMAIAHKKFDVRGLQFHPESVMTRFGRRIIENWLKL